MAETLSFDAEEDAFSLDDVSFGGPDMLSGTNNEDKEAFSVEPAPDALDFGEFSASEVASLTGHEERDEEALFFSENLEELSFNSEFEPTFDGRVRADEAEARDSAEEESGRRSEMDDARKSYRLPVDEGTSLPSEEESHESFSPDRPDGMTAFGEEFTVADVEEGEAPVDPGPSTGRKPVLAGGDSELASFGMDTFEELPANLATDVDLSPGWDAAGDEVAFSSDLDEAETASGPKSEDVLPAENEQMRLAFNEGEEIGEAEVIPDIHEIRKGGFFRRFIAFAVDSIVQAVIIYAFILAGFYALKKGVAVTGEGLSVEQIAHLLGPIWLMAVIVNAGYFTFFHCATGQTPGKMILGLKVVGKDGRPLTLGRSFLRWFSYFLSALPFMLGYLIVLFDRQKRALHDRVAGTCVIDARGLIAEDENGDEGDDLTMSPRDENEV